MKMNSFHIFLKRLYTALSSKKSAAYLGLAILFIGPFTRLADRFIFRRRRDNKKFILPPVLLIACSSRNGGTIVTQILSRIIPSVYISNYTALFPHRAYTYMSRKGLFGMSGLEAMNFFGYTGSIWDVNEGNFLFQKLFEDNPDRATLRNRFLDLLFQLGGNAGRPVILKNVWSYDRIKELHDALPELKVIRLTRGEEQVAQSMINTYYKLGYFNPTPQNCLPDSYDHPAKYAIAQIHAVQEIIDKQISQLPGESVYTMTYEDFCDRTIYHCETICAKLLGDGIRTLRPEILKHPLKASMKQKISNEDLGILKEAMLNRAT